MVEGKIEEMVEDNAGRIPRGFPRKIIIRGEMENFSKQLVKANSRNIMRHSEEELKGNFIDGKISGMKGTNQGSRCKGQSVESKEQRQFKEACFESASSQRL